MVSKARERSSSNEVKMIAVPPGAGCDSAGFWKAQRGRRPYEGYSGGRLVGDWSTRQVETFSQSEWLTVVEALVDKVGLWLVEVVSAALQMFPGDVSEPEATKVVFVRDRLIYNENTRSKSHTSRPSTKAPRSNSAALQIALTNAELTAGLRGTDPTTRFTAPEIARLSAEQKQLRVQIRKARTKRISALNPLHLPQHSTHIHSIGTRHHQLKVSNMEQRSDSAKMFPAVCPLTRKPSPQITMLDGQGTIILRQRTAVITFHIKSQLSKDRSIPIRGTPTPDAGIQDRALVCLLQT
ncbi:hypothetical protein CCR75_000284 [Bremia lactucae]|uniref:Uncharacterized protein n=1 Tax=Bremia lactucae TaxID=4779 RepID=A0A976IEJ0_BRELC|nr:hypothetical protein CCR75_000284 [Bremia lactucae]